eukprot:14291-Ditylum_brightwellii.AAC.1
MAIEQAEHEREAICHEKLKQPQQYTLHPAANLTSTRSPHQEHMRSLIPTRTTEPSHRGNSIVNSKTGSSIPLHIVEMAEAEQIAGEIFWSQLIDDDIEAESATDADNGIINKSAKGPTFVECTESEWNHVLSPPPTHLPIPTTE